MKPSRKVLLYAGIIVASWILILAISPLRNMFLAQSFRGSGNVLPSAMPARSPDYNNLALQHPRNLSVRLLQISRQIGEWREYDLYEKVVGWGNPNDMEEPPKPTISKKGIDKELAQLITDFPDLPLPVFFSITYSMKEMEPIREGGRLTDPKGAEHIKQGIPSPERKGERNYSQEQWQHVMDLCKKGQQLYPDNGIFDVLEAYWQFAEFHDEKGWEAMRRAVQKPEINNYPLEIGRENVASQRIRLKRNLMWEELVMYSPNVISLQSPWSAFGVSSLSSKLREFERWILWEGIKQEKRGNHSTALDMYSLIFQMANLMVRSSHNSLSYSIGVAYEGMAISGPREAGVKPDIDLDKSDMFYYSQRNQAAFKKYAREHGRPELARYAEITGVHRKRSRSSLEVIKDAQKKYFPQAIAGSLLWRLDVLLLWLIAGAAIAGIIAAVASLVKGKNTNYREYDFWRGAISFCALPASLVLIVGYAFVIYHQSRQIDFMESIINLRLFVDFGMSMMWLAVIGIATPILFGIAYCWKRAAEANSHQDTPKVLLWQRAVSIIGSILFVISWAVFATQKMPFPTGEKTFLDLFYTYVLGAPEIANGEKLINLTHLSLFVIAAGILIYIATAAIRAFKNKNIKSTFGDFVSLLANSSLRFVAITSVVYLLTLAIAIPIRAPLHALEIHKMEHGEMSLYEDALKSTFPMSDENYHF